MRLIIEGECALVETLPPVIRLGGRCTSLGHVFRPGAERCECGAMEWKVKDDRH